MKLKDVEVGGRYHAKVSGTLAVVRVVEVEQIPPAYHLPNGNWRTLIYAVNRGNGAADHGPLASAPATFARERLRVSQFIGLAP